VFDAAGQYTFDRNVMGPRAAAYSGFIQPGTLAHDNRWVGDSKQFGVSPWRWDDVAVVSHLGVSEPQIDAAVAAIETAFAGDVAKVYTDKTIESNFAVLAGALDRWAAL
jgi:hypothetical protein